MRIAYFTDTYLPEVNGVVTSLDGHSRALGERGHECLIICPKYRKPVLHIVPHVQIKRYRSFSFITNKETRVALPSLASIVATLRRFSPDIVHVHTPLSVGVIGLATARMMRLPVVQTYHTYIPDFMQYVELHRLLRLDDLQDRVVNSLIFERLFESDAWKRMERGRTQTVEEFTNAARAVLGSLGPGEREALSARAAWQYTRTVYNRSALVLTPSVTLKRALEEHGVTVPVEYLSNGIDTSIVEPKTSYAPTGRLLHAGRLGYEKNVDIVVKAFSRLVAMRPELRLDVVGDGPARESLERLAARLGIAEAVRFHGFADRHALGRMYRDHDVFITASTIETQGIVLLEAMSAGLPVVGVDALAIPELVRHERDGLIVPSGDVDALAATAGRLLADEDLRTRFGAACREDVRPHALGAVIERLETLYAGVRAAAPVPEFTRP